MGLVTPFTVFRKRHDAVFILLKWFPSFMENGGPMKTVNSARRAGGPFSTSPADPDADGMTSLSVRKRTPPRPRHDRRKPRSHSRVLAKSSIQIYGMGSGEKEREGGERERERQRERAGGQFPSDWRPTEEITAEGERYSGRPGRRGRRRAKYLPRGLWEHKGEWEREGQSPKGRQSDRPEWPAPIERERMKGRPRPAARQTVRAAAADANGDNADTKF